MLPKRITPWMCVVVNQAAFPGLGTKLAGRRVGYLQMAIMLAGFCLFAGFMLWPVVCAIRDIQGVRPIGDLWRESYQEAGWAGWWGLGLCLVAWLWAGISSIRILRSGTNRPPPSDRQRHP